MPTYNRVVYHEGKHETDVTAECTKIKLSTATLHTCRYVVSTAQDKPNQTSKQLTSFVALNLHRSRRFPSHFTLVKMRALAARDTHRFMIQKRLGPLGTDLWIWTCC